MTRRNYLLDVCVGTIFSTLSLISVLENDLLTMILWNVFLDHDFVEMMSWKRFFEMNSSVQVGLHSPINKYKLIP